MPSASGTEGLSGTEAIALLSRLHKVKNAGYGDAWRKRGELLSIFTNLARKYDRLVVSLDQRTRSSDERILDTAGDLCIYAAKYLTWLAAEHPTEFQASSPLPAVECADDGSAAPLERVLGELQVPPREGSAQAWTELRGAFEPLDAALVAQANEGHAAISWEDRVQLAWKISAASAALLLALAAEEPSELASWREEIEAMG